MSDWAGGDPLEEQSTFAWQVKPALDRIRSLKRELLQEQSEDSASDLPVSAEPVLTRWPEDSTSDTDMASVLFENFRQRRQQADPSSIVEYSADSLDGKTSLERLVEQQTTDRVNDPIQESRRGLGLPDVGDELFGFRLRQELGRGAFARVFRAEQADLAGRPVVLKISAIEGTEPQTLAQLQHTHIVPIYSVHEDARAGLRAVCMPYFGGTSLLQVLRELMRRDPLPTQGMQVSEALLALQQGAPGNQAESRDPIPGSLPRPADAQTPCMLWRQMTFPQVAAWIVARLAEALHHAHLRGVLHRDIKPSNILISDDGQPLLLDFNTAVNPRENPAAATLGGTLAYMAPEHLRALAGATVSLARQVDERSDIYSLGTVLYEMLTGHNPFSENIQSSMLHTVVGELAARRAETVPSLRQRRLDLPWALESIVRKCLAPDPAHRYQQAEDVAEDLRRFLDDRPLRFAPELSQKERLRKWMRRHPRLTSSASVATAASLLLAACGLALLGVRNHLQQAQEKIHVAMVHERQEAYEAGTLRALCQVNTISDLGHFAEGQATCAQTLALYHVLEDPDWQDRADWLELADQDRLHLAENTRELLLLLAAARVRERPGDKQTVREALGILDKAEQIRSLAPSRALLLDRANYLQQLGEESRASETRKQAESVQPQTAQDFYLLATVHARQGGSDGLELALADLEAALRLNPRHYWALVQRGICHEERGDHALAAGDFGACIGLQPDFAWGYFNRGYVLGRSGARRAAIADYSAALERDPQFAPAAVNRGLARLEEKQYASALADFDNALTLGRNDAFLHTGRGMALEALGRHTEADRAFDQAMSEAEAVTREERFRLRALYALAVAERLPGRARAALDEVLEQQPRHAHALYGRARLSLAAGQLAEAVTFLNRAVESQAAFLDARRLRALVEARRGRHERASQDINWCLNYDPRGAETLFVAACVAARIGEQYGDSAATEQATTLLQRAITAGQSLKSISESSDLAGIRSRPEFKLWLSRTACEASHGLSAAP